MPSFSHSAAKVPSDDRVLLPFIHPQPEALQVNPALFPADRERPRGPGSLETTEISATLTGFQSPSQGNGYFN